MTDPDRMEFPAFAPRCPEGALEIELTVAPCQTDPSGRMTPQAVAGVMEAVFREQMEACGWGRETVERTNVTWVVGWTSILIRRPPRAGEKLMVRIWPGRKKLAMHVRKYAFFSENGEALVSAAVLLLAMDRRSRKLTMAAERLHLPEVVSPGEAAVPELRVDFPGELPHQRTRKVQSHEIDENGHMNNTCYLEWVNSLCGEDWLGQHEPQSIWVQYLNELTVGQAVKLEHVTQGQRLYVRGTTNGSTAFLAVIQYASCGSPVNGQDCLQHLNSPRDRTNQDIFERSGREV